MVMKWALALPSFVFLLTGCGGPQAAHPSTSGHSPVPTASAATTPNPTATPVPVSAAPILTPGAIPLTVFSLKPGGQAGGTLTCPEWVVLNSTRLSYTDSELNEMANAFRIVANAGLFPKTIPDTLRIIQGRPTPLPKALATASPDCAIFLQITNTGRGTVQIPEVGFLLTRDPEPNRDQYRLVEACSLQGSRQYCGPERGGGPTGCSVYVADVQLQTGGAGTAFTTSPKPARPDLQCPEITLGPGQSTEIYLTSSSSPDRTDPGRGDLKRQNDGGDPGVREHRFIRRPIAVHLLSAQRSCIHSQLVRHGRTGLGKPCTPECVVYLGSTLELRPARQGCGLLVCGDL